MLACLFFRCWAGVSGGGGGAGGVPGFGARMPRMHFSTPGNVRAGVLLFPCRAFR